MGKHYNFIKKAYNGELGLTMCQDWKNKILENYPEFKEEEFKVGDWIVPCFEVRRLRPHRINMVTDTHYVTDPWHDSEINTIGFNRENKYRKATKEEVEECLIAEAERRCLVSGVGIKPLKDWFYGIANSMVIEHECNYIYYPSNDTLVVKSSNDYTICLYSNGKWAEKINTMTKSEAEKKLNELGVNIKIVD